MWHDYTFHTDFWFSLVSSEWVEGLKEIHALFHKRHPDEESDKQGMDVMPIFPGEPWSYFIVIVIVIFWKKKKKKKKKSLRQIQIS